MWTVAFVITATICATKWLKWKIAVMSLAYYIEKNQYKQPSNKEMAECTDFVVKNMIKDLVHLKVD